MIVLNNTNPILTSTEICYKGYYNGYNHFITGGLQINVLFSRYHWLGTPSGIRDII